MTTFEKYSQSLCQKSWPVNSNHAKDETEFTDNNK